MSLTEREKQLFEILHNNPLIAQKDIAEAMFITRSSVAVHIANLSAKGYIKGKGYIFSNQDEKQVVVIGATNIDITGISNQKLLEGESNIGALKLGAGGVARNIADNLARLSINEPYNIILLSALGKDVHGDLVISQSDDAGIDMQHCLRSSNMQTASYLSIVDELGEMRMAINDMAITQLIDIDYLKKHKAKISNAALIIMDANLEQTVIEYICQNFGHVPIFADTVSASKAMKFMNVYSYIHTLTPNLNEAEILSGIKADKQNLSTIANFFHQKGVKNLYITQGENGVYVSRIANNNIVETHIPSLNGEIVNANGAGDAFIAALAYGFLNEIPEDTLCYFAQACAFSAAQSPDTINTEISPKMAIQYMEKQNETK